MNFTLHASPKILFGRGLFKKFPKEILGNFKRVLFIHGHRRESTVYLADFLKDNNYEFIEYEVFSEPSVEVVDQAVQIGRKQNTELVISLGGGSVIDTGKAVAALIPLEFKTLAYLEVIGEGKTFKAKPLPFIAIPTIAGTGAEVTSNAVIISPAHKVKASLRHPTMFPTVSLIDPELTYSVPPSLTAQTGFDALVQLIEPFVSRFANPFTDALCKEGLGLIKEALPKAYKNGEDPMAREKLCIASFFSGLALSNAKLGAVHGIAGPLGGIISAPHGSLCAALLAPVIKYNLKKAREAVNALEVIERYREISKIFLEEKTDLDYLPEYFSKFRYQLGISGLKKWGVTDEIIENTACKAELSSSMKGNPFLLNKDEIIEILNEAID